MKKILALAISLTIMVLFASHATASPSIDFKGSGIAVGGAGLSDFYFGGAYTEMYECNPQVDWYIEGIIKANLRLTDYKGVFAFLNAKLNTYSKYGGLTCWTPIYQDYFWKLGFGYEYEKFGATLFVEQYCFHTFNGPGRLWGASGITKYGLEMRVTL